MSENSKVLCSTQDVLKAFINHNPQAHYIFDPASDAGPDQPTNVCRVGAGKSDLECMTVQMNPKRLFEAMQELGFFCALPSDPGKTHIECRPFPK